MTRAEYAAHEPGPVMAAVGREMMRRPELGGVLVARSKRGALWMVRGGMAERFDAARKRLRELVIRLATHLTSPAGALTTGASLTEMSWLLLGDAGRGPEEEYRRLRIALWLDELRQMRLEKGWDPDDDYWPMHDRRQA